jgi:hypothetical protein
MFNVLSGYEGLQHTVQYVGVISEGNDASVHNVCQTGSIANFCRQNETRGALKTKTFMNATGETQSHHTCLLDEMRRSPKGYTVEMTLTFAFRDHGKVLFALISHQIVSE